MFMGKSNILDNINYSTRIFLGYISVTLLAFILRVSFISNPSAFVFDEAYYVPDSYSLYKYGYVVQWFSFENQNYASQNFLEYLFKTMEPYSDTMNTTHPPLGQYLIGLFMLFDPFEPTMWRLSSAVFGTLTVVATMWLTWELFKKHTIALTAGVLISLSNLNIAMSSVALLDIFLTFFILTGLVFSVKYYKNIGNTSLKIFNKNLMLSGLFLGLALSVKWSAIYYIAGLTLIILVRQAHLIYKNNEGTSKSVLYFLFQNISAYMVILTTYIFMWIPQMFFYTRAISETNILKTLIEWHVKTYNDLVSASYQHDYKSNALEWIWLSRPTELAHIFYDNGYVSQITTFPNFLLWFGGLIALAFGLVSNLVKKYLSPSTLFLTFGFIAGWAPWLLYYERTTFFYYSVVFEPYMIIMLAWLITLIKNRKFFSTIFIMITVLTITLYPSSTGMYVKTENILYQYSNIFQNFLVK